MNKLSREDIATLEVLAVTEESKGKLAEYVQQQGKATKAYKAFREAVANGIEVDKVEKVAKEKTPNELRAEIIQRAKDFVEENKNTVIKKESRYYEVDASFIVNAGKSTVVALMMGVSTGLVRAKGIAKCNPDDVFNEHIGKAIALGRALGKDVSELENAVQPNFEVGQTARLMPRYEGRESEIQIIKVDEDKLWFVNEFGVEMYMDTGVNVVEITDDTNAQYKECVE